MEYDPVEQADGTVWNMSMWLEIVSKALFGPLCNFCCSEEVILSESRYRASTRLLQGSREWSSQEG